jgi:outer membrane protein assembly factor BamE (lipoprotein component of BamABCDE complex)
MKTISFISCIAIIIVSSGCFSSKVGNELSREQVSQIQPGMYRPDVERILGAPTTTAPDGQGGMIFYYTFSEIKVRGSTYIPIVGSFTGGSDTEQKNVTVYFDRNGRVKDMISSY